MTPPSQTGGPWPNHHQLLLLRAALLPREQALAAWAQWRAEVDIEQAHPDPASFRLMPLLSQALSQHGADDPFLPRLRGIHRNRWVRNQLAQQAWLAGWQGLQAAGIHSLAVGNVALLPRHSQDGGLRPADPAEWLVRQGEMAQATHALLAQGWRPRDGRPTSLISAAQEVRASLAFVDKEERGCILRWRLAAGGKRGDAFEEALWAAAQPVAIEIQGEKIRASALCPEDELLFLCLRAWEDLPPPPVDWLADAVAILRREGDRLDGSRLARMAGLSGAAPAVRDLLAYLVEEFEVKLPAHLLAELARLPVTPELGRRYALWASPSGRFGALGRGWGIYRQLAARRGARSFREFARLYYGKESQAQLLVWVARRLTRPHLGA